MSPFETWWYNEGSGPSLTPHDHEEHTKRMCAIAWANGADLAREASAKEAEAQGRHMVATAIRARSQQ